MATLTDDFTRMSRTDLDHFIAAAARTSYYCTISGDRALGLEFLERAHAAMRERDSHPPLRWWHYFRRNP